MDTVQIIRLVPPGAAGVSPSGIAYVRGGPRITGYLKTYWVAHPDCPRCGRPRGAPCQMHLGLGGHDMLTPHPERRLTSAAPDGLTSDAALDRDLPAAPLGSTPQLDDWSTRMIDAQPTLDAVARATHAAMLAATGFVVENREQLQACTPITRDALLVRFALTFLASNGLVSIAGEERFDGEWMNLFLEPPFADAMAAAVTEGVEEQARINAALR